MKPRVICHHCQRPGHIRPKCPDLAPRLHTASETPGTGTYGNVQVPRVTSPANRVQSVGSTLHLPIQIGKRKYKALLDSGSEVTLLPAKAAEGFEMSPSYRVLRAANGTEISVLGSMTVDLKVGKLRLSTVFVVSDQIDEAILGMDWMNQHKCLLDCGSNTLKIQDQSFELSKKSLRDCTHRVVSRVSVEIPARTEALVPGKAVYTNFKRLHSDLWSTEPRECIKGLHSARGLIKLTTGTDIPIRVVNLNESPVIVQEGTYLSALSEVHSVADDSSPADVNSDLIRNQQLRQHISDMSSKIHPEVSPAQKLQLEHLLFQFGDILSCNEMDLGQYRYGATQY